MKKVITSMVAVTAISFSQTVIVPVESDINLCQQNIDKKKGELISKVDSRFLTQWFKKAFSDSIDRETIEYLKSDSTLYEVESALANFEVIVEGKSCKNFVANLQYSFPKALENIDKVSKNNLGTQVQLYKTDKYTISSSSADVYTSVLGDKKRIETLGNGTKLRLTDQYVANLYVKWGEFVFKSSKDGKKRIGWINMNNVSMEH